MRIVHCVPLLAALAVACPAFAQVAGIETEMTAEERQATGVERLSADELTRLNAWLQQRAGRHIAGDADAAVETRIADAREAGRRDAMAGARGLRPAAEARAPITSTIPGTFEGFAPHRQYTLANGQVWKQTDDATLSGARGENVSARIRPGALGVWWLQVEGYNRQAKVERIR